MLGILQIEIHFSAADRQRKRIAPRAAAPLNPVARSGQLGHLRDEFQRDWLLHS